MTNAVTIFSACDVYCKWPTRGLAIGLILSILGLLSSLSRLDFSDHSPLQYGHLDHLKSAMKSATVAEAKAKLSELIGEVAHAGHSVVITKRGRPVAMLVPVDEQPPAHPAKIKGWLEDDDPFFSAMDDIQSERAEHKPRRVDL